MQLLPLTAWNAFTTTMVAGAVALAACRSPRSACVWTLATPAQGVSEICRDDRTATTCVAGTGDLGAPVFTPGRTCPDVGFVCLGDRIDAAYRRTHPDGTCPPGTTMAR